MQSYMYNKYKHWCSGKIWGIFNTNAISVHNACALTLVSLLSVYLRVYLCEGDWSACLPVHQSAQPGLALDDAVRDTHLAAKSWEEDHQLEKQKKTLSPGIYIYTNIFKSWWRKSW